MSWEYLVQEHNSEALIASCRLDLNLHEDRVRLTEFVNLVIKEAFERGQERAPIVPMRAPEAKAAGSPPQATAPKESAAIPVTLRDAFSGTDRTIYVSSKLDAQVLQDFIVMSSHAARASVEPVMINNKIDWPDRRTESTVTRNLRGDITKVEQIETSV